MRQIQVLREIIDAIRDTLIFKASEISARNYKLIIGVCDPYLVQDFDGDTDGHVGAIGRLSLKGDGRDIGRFQEYY